MNEKELTQEVSHLWSTSKQGQDQAYELIASQFNAHRMARVTQKLHLADRTFIINDLYSALHEEDDPDRIAYFINKIKVNTYNGTPLLDISRGRYQSRFVDFANMVELIGELYR